MVQRLARVELAFLDLRIFTFVSSFLLSLDKLFDRLVGVIGVMNLCECLQRVGRRLVVVDENVLVGSRLVERFQSVQLRRVVVSMELVVVAMLVSKHAFSAISTHFAPIERAAVIWLERVTIALYSSLGKLVLSVSEPTLAFKTASSRLYPVSAKLSLVVTIPVMYKGLMGRGKVLHAEVHWCEAGRLLVGSEESAGLSRNEICRSRLERIVLGLIDRLWRTHSSLGSL